MAKIPYVFKAIPDEFLTDEFLEDPIMMKLIREIMTRIRATPHTYEFTCNNTRVLLNLDAFDFAFGRKALAKKLQTTEEIIKKRINKLYKLKFVERYPEKRTSSSTSSSARNSTSSYSKNSTSSYSICRLCVERFKRQINEDDNQQLPSKKNQQFNQQFGPDLNHKEEALASSPSGSNLYAEEEQQQTRKPGVVVAIEEGYQYIKKIFENVQECMLCCVDPPLTAETAMQNITALELSDRQVVNLLKKFPDKPYHVMLAIHWAYLNKDKIHTSIMGTITQNCKSEKPWDFEKKKIDPKDLVKSLFKKGETYFEKEYRIQVDYDEKEIVFTNHFGHQKSLKYNSDGFEDKLYAMINHLKIPIENIA